MSITDYIRLDHGDDPIATFLRKHAMKTPFIQSLERDIKADESSREGIYPENPGSKLVVYGSTLMWRLAMDGAKMPFIGLKVSDIDIGVALPNACYGTEEQFTRHITPRLIAAAQENGFQFARLKPGASSRNHSIDDFERVDPAMIHPKDLHDDFYVCKSFTPAEIRALVGASHENHGLETYIDDKPKEVFMLVSAHRDQFPFLMEPIRFEKEENGCNQLFRHDRYDTIAGKLARTMGRNPKSHRSDRSS